MTLIKNPLPIGPGEKWEITEDQLAQIMQAEEGLRILRGETLGLCLEVEEEVEHIILGSFFGPNYEKKKVFHNAVLKREFYTFFQKWKTLKELVDLKHVPVENSGLVGNIHECIKIRNKFAHGRFFFSGTQPKVEYFEDGLKEDIIDSTYINQTFAKIIETRNELIKVANQMNKDGENETKWRWK